MLVLSCFADNSGCNIYQQKLGLWRQGKAKYFELELVAVGQSRTGDLSRHYASID